jgi:hypothetical protein
MMNRDEDALSEIGTQPLDSCSPAHESQRRNLREKLEPVAMGIMGLGGVMMFQPFTKVLFAYSFTVILLGTLMFIVVSHLPE